MDALHLDDQSAGEIPDLGFQGEIAASLLGRPEIDGDMPGATVIADGDGRGGPPVSVRQVDDGVGMGVHPVERVAWIGENDLWIMAESVRVTGSDEIDHA